MPYLLQFYRQENSLKCRLRNKLLKDDIHITINDERECVAEGTDKKTKPTPKKQWTWMYCSKLFDLVQPSNILTDAALPTSRAQFFFTSAKREW